MNKKVIYTLTLALSISLTSVVLASNINKERVFGSHRYETSAKICDREFTSNTEAVANKLTPEEILASLSESEIRNYVQNGWNFIINSAVGINKDILKNDNELIMNNKYYHELKDEYSTREGLLNLLNKNFSKKYSNKLIDSLYYEKINGKYYIVIGQPGLAFELSKSKIIDKKIQGNKLYITWSGCSECDEQYSPKKAVLKYENGKVVIDYYEELSMVGNVQR